MVTPVVKWFEHGTRRRSDTITPLNVAMVCNPWAAVGRDKALGVAQGLSGYGSYSYFGAPTNHFAGALFQWSWSNNFNNYFGNYKDANDALLATQTTYNSYLSQYYVPCH